MDAATKKILLDSNYGRRLGWTVSLDGKAMAHLSEPRQAEMFWYRYRVEALDPRVFEQAFWHQEGPEFRNRVTGHIAPYAFAGGELPSEDSPIVLMRALYIPVKPTWQHRLRSIFLG